MFSNDHHHQQSVRLIYRFLIRMRVKNGCSTIFHFSTERMRRSHGSHDCKLTPYVPNVPDGNAVPKMIIYLKENFSFRQRTFNVRIESVTMLNKLFIILWTDTHYSYNSYLAPKIIFPFSKMYFAFSFVFCLGCVHLQNFRIIVG